MLACWVVLAVPFVRAERFAGIAEAQKLMFPGAVSFQAAPARYTAAEVRAIEKRSGARVLRAGNQMWIARDGTNFLGVVIHDQVLGKHELIDYAVAIDAEGRVQSVEILEYRESYGGEIRGAKWRAQFRGKGARDPIRLHKDIHNLSGATMSCRHVTEGVKRLVATYDLVRARLLDGAGMSQPVAAASASR
jgi:Na+-translocating ferredoxin:NAD+ oxidoreductase RnfG subunit